MSNCENRFERAMDVVEFYVKAEKVTVKQLAHAIVVTDRTIYNWINGGAGEPSSTQINLWLRDRHLPEEFRFHLACAQLAGSGFPIGTEREPAAPHNLMGQVLGVQAEVLDVARKVHKAGRHLDQHERLEIRAEAIEAREAIDSVIAATEAPRPGMRVTA